MTISRQFAGKAPYEEVWFCEFMTGQGQGLWIRYTIAASEQGLEEAAVWAMAFSREDGVLVGKDVYPLQALDPAGSRPFSVEGNWLDATGAEGKAGPISWSLQFHDRGLNHEHLPSLLKRLPVVTRHWVPAILDLRCSGRVELGENTLPLFSEQPGVLGHIWGKSNSLRDWAWSHCNTFPEEPDACFEGLSARLDRPLLRHKTLSTFVLYCDERLYSFSGKRQWVGSQSKYGGRRWSFEAKGDGTTLSGEAELPEPATTARVEYPGTAGGSVFCSNSRLSRLRLRLLDPKRGIDRVLTSNEAAFELGAQDRPSHPLHLSANPSQSP